MADCMIYCFQPIQQLKCQFMLSFLQTCINRDPLSHCYSSRTKGSWHKSLVTRQEHGDFGLWKLWYSILSIYFFGETTSLSKHFQIKSHVPC